MKNFPTIAQLQEAVADVYNAIHVSYDATKLEFLAVCLRETPHYDSGGGVDCIDFVEVETSLSYEQAYCYWLHLADPTAYWERDDRRRAHWREDHPMLDEFLVVDDDLPF